MSLRLGQYFSVEPDRRDPLYKTLTKNRQPPCPQARGPPAPHEACSPRLGPARPSRLGPGSPPSPLPPWRFPRPGSCPQPPQMAELLRLQHPEALPAPRSNSRVDVAPWGAWYPLLPQPQAPVWLQLLPSPARALRRLKFGPVRDPTAGVLRLELAEKEVPESIGAWDASSPSAACEGVQRDPSRTKLGQRLHLCPINLSCGKLKKKKELNISIS